MAPIDRRVRAWAWLVRRQGSFDTKSDAEIIAMQSRPTPSNALTNRIFGTIVPGTVVSDRTIDGPGGNLPVRVYRPARGGPGARPLILNFHGGGFVFGDLRLADWMCSSVAVTVDAVVVSVDYRLAPGHRFPAAVDDCYAALVWAAEHAADLGAAGPGEATAPRIGVMGESAGGNLSAVTCLAARDRGGPRISHQALLYPATDLTRMPPNAADSLIISEPEMLAFRRLYLGDADPADPRVSPLLATDHSGLPAALIQVGEHDPLREDGARYAAALQSAGVPVRFTEYVGMPHGYLNFPGICRAAPQALAEICAEQAAALAPSGHAYPARPADRGSPARGRAAASRAKLSSHLTQRVLRLDPPLTRHVVAQRDLRVPMPDGVELLADRYAPRDGGDSLPLALMRCPYGRRGLIAAGMAVPLAERGFQVLLQSTRGTFGSGGEFDPLRQEREDGLATLGWVVKQPWFGGSIVLVGGSYLGYVQWAVADSLPPEVKAMIPQETDSALTLEFLRPDGFSLETPFSWGAMIAGQERPLGMLRGLVEAGRWRRAMNTLPLGRADVAAIGHRSDYIQDILARDADDPRWAGVDHRHRVAQVKVPVCSIAGWYDIFLPGQLRDFTILQQAGRRPRLVVGPWTHLSIDGTAVREAVEFGLACARDGRPPDRAPVRLYVMGEEAWRDFDAWPPPGYAPTRFHLQPGGALSGRPPGESGPDRYRYNPAHPTPAVGGVRMTRSAGRADNTELEARPDVLTFTTAPLDADTEVIGDVSAEIWFGSSLRYADVFVRVCDVDPGGRSRNVCDGLTSLTGADTVSRADVRLWPTAHRFKAGHRIRVQVSSGAFPRFARNPGTGAPRATAARLVAADQAVYHDPEHPSAVILPVRQG
jgi:uncharacterized protein